MFIFRNATFWALWLISTCAYTWLLQARIRQEIDVTTHMCTHTRGFVIAVKMVTQGPGLGNIVVVFCWQEQSIERKV